MHDARQIANFMLDYADSQRVSLTNMALLKHIYFAHGWHLAAEGSPLITNRVEAWEHGPVVRAVYDCFKSFGGKPITSRATSIDWVTGEIVELHGSFSISTMKLLRSTLRYYSGYGAFELSEITHQPGGPWDRIWNATDGKVRLNMEIPNDSIRSHFLNQSQFSTIQ